MRILRWTDGETKKGREMMSKIDELYESHDSHQLRIKRQRVNLGVGIYNIGLC